MAMFEQSMKRKSSQIKAKTPSLFGYPPRTYLGKNSSSSTNKKIFAKKRREAAIQQILEFYKPAWENLLPNQKKSVSGIANALVRRRIITQYSDSNRVASILQYLARKKIIVLPPKKNRGGARKRKK